MNPEIRTVTEIAMQDAAIQGLSLLIVIEILFSQIVQLTINKDNKIAVYWILALMTGIAHSFIFYVVLNLDRYTTLNITPLFGSYTQWSSIRAFHLYGVLGIIEGMRGWIAFSTWRIKRRVQRK